MSLVLHGRPARPVPHTSARSRVIHHPSEHSSRSAARSPPTLHKGDRKLCNLGRLTTNTSLRPGRRPAHGATGRQPHSRCHWPPAPLTVPLAVGPLAVHSPREWPSFRPHPGRSWWIFRRFRGLFLGCLITCGQFLVRATRSAEILGDLPPFPVVNPPRSARAEPEGGHSRGELTASGPAAEKKAPSGGKSAKICQGQGQGRGQGQGQGQGRGQGRGRGRKGDTRAGTDRGRASSPEEDSFRR